MGSSSASSELEKYASVRKNARLNLPMAMSNRSYNLLRQMQHPILSNAFYIRIEFFAVFPRSKPFLAKYCVVCSGVEGQNEVTHEPEGVVLDSCC
eukprot:snap_masked-scaffold_1-processed-gene-27.18-mRNA-1 protein AED:1.00 eAED:1.00 QI:0/0/0/0/1/1/2/0/94